MKIIQLKNKMDDSELHKQTEQTYTFMFFHLPLLNRINPVMAMAVSATGMAMKTPSGPKSITLASR